VNVLVQGDARRAERDVLRQSERGDERGDHRPQGLGTITDDDLTPTFSINDVTVTEGNWDGQRHLQRHASAASGRTTTVDWATANGTAVAPGDYLTGGTTLTSRRYGDVADPCRRQRRRARRKIDVQRQPVEPTNATGRWYRARTITDDDNAPNTINDVNVTEGNAGTVTMAFTVSLSAASGRR
jgi:hypothetical protein